MNLPDLSVQPWVTDPDQKKLLAQVTGLHNSKLADAVAAIQSNNPDVILHLTDANAFMAELYNSLDNFNEKYHTHIKNITDPCWPGGYSLRQSLQAKAVVEQFQKDLALNPVLKKGSAPTTDVRSFAQTVAKNPDLGAAFAVEKAIADGQTPCADPDSYAYWDGVHPTNAMHTVMAGLMIDVINQYYHVE